MLMTSEDNCKANIPVPRHPERTTAKRAEEKDPVRYVSRSDSALNGPSHPV